MKELLNQLLRGVIIGLSNIIPGVSGGTMMVSMGVYDTLIHCITHLKKEFKKSILTLLPYAIGMLAGIIGLASVINWGLENFPLPTNALFIGLILGGLGPLVQKIDRKNIRFPAVLAFLALFGLVLWMGFQQRDSIHNAETIDLNALQLLILVGIGMIASATMIIPGVSGSLVIMLLGYYKPVVNALSQIKDGIVTLNFSLLGTPVLMFLPYLLGVVLGIYGVAKLIEWLTARYPTPTYAGVLGLVLASPVTLLLQTDLTGVSVVTVLISAVLLAAGFTGAYLLGKGSKEA